jgi:hypothetical protein
LLQHAFLKVPACKSQGIVRADSGGLLQAPYAQQESSKCCSLELPPASPEEVGAMIAMVDGDTDIAQLLLCHSTTQPAAGESTSTDLLVPDSTVIATEIRWLVQKQALYCSPVIL